MAPSTTPAKSASQPVGNDHADSKPKGILGLIERAGNALPDPFWLFAILSVVVLIISWIGSKAGLSATNPASGEEVAVTNLLSTEGLQHMVSEAVTNYISFPPLGVILVVMLGIAVAEHAGLISAAMRGAVGKVQRPWLVTFVIAITGVTGSIASDAVYVIVIPLGAAAFKAIGRSPIVGAMVAFAASSGGFNASLLPNVTDVLLGGISTSAAGFVDPNYEVSPLANYLFVVPSAILLSIIITLLTELYMNRRTEQLIDHSKVNYEAASFTKPAAGLSDDDDSHETDEPQHEVVDDSDGLTLDAEEKRGLITSGLVALGLLAAFFALLLIPGSPFEGEDGDPFSSVLITSIAVVIAVIFGITGIAYGLAAKTIRSPGDVPAFMAKGIMTMVPMLVLFFAVSQFLAYFQWSNLGEWTAIRGSELLTKVDLPPALLFTAFVLLVALINLLITSGSAQWALMAPVVVPMFMLVGIDPETTQMVYRIGDSTANIVTPMSPYFALALTFLQRYYKKAGVGTLMSLSIPYAVTMLVGWFAFFLIWHSLGIPLGVNA